MGQNYESIENLQLSVNDSDIYSIDVLVDVPTTTTRVLEYIITHRFPYQGEPNGKIFLGAFGSGSDQFDNEWFPYYQKLTEFVSNVTHGVIESRYHSHDLVVRPSSAITQSRVLGWIEEYNLNADIRPVLGRIRLNK